MDSQQQQSGGNSPGGGGGSGDGLGVLELLLVGSLIALIVVSVVGNCLVCVAIFTDRRLRKLGNAFIVSLAIADLFVSCLVMTFALCNDLMNYWIFGEWFCDVWISFDIMCCTASILNLCAISLDRFIHIKDCLLYNQWMTRRVALSAVVIIWCISATVSFVPINLGWHKPNHFSSTVDQQQPLDSVAAAVATPRKLNYLPLRPIENQSSPSAGPPTTTTTTTTSTTGKATTPNSSLDFLTSVELANELANELASNSTDSDNDNKPDRRQLRPNNSSGLRAGRQFNKVESNPPDGSQIGPDPPPPPSARQRRPPERSDNYTHRRPEVATEPTQQPLPLCMLSLTPTYAIISSTISFYIPCIIMLGLYTKLFACARRHVRNIQALGKAPAPLLSHCPSPPPPTQVVSQVSPARADTTCDNGGSVSGLRTWLKLAVSRSPTRREATTIAADAADTSTAQSSGQKSGHSGAPAASPAYRLEACKASSTTTTTTPTISPAVHKQQPDKWIARLISSAQRLLDERPPNESARGGQEEEQDPFLARQADSRQPQQHPQPQPQQQQQQQKQQQTYELTAADPSHLSRQPTSASQRSTKSTTNQSQVSVQFQLQQQRQQQQQQQQQSGQLATHKAAITLGIIMGTFLFCWVPFFCLNIIKAFCVDCIPSSLFRAFTWLGYANSALNPIIYGIHNSEFRCAFNRIFFKHLNIKNSRYYLNRRFSYDLRHQANLERRTAANRKSRSQNTQNNDNNNNNNNTNNNDSNNDVDSRNKQSCNKSDTVT